MKIKIKKSEDPIIMKINYTNLRTCLHPTIMKKYNCELQPLTHTTINKSYREKNFYTLLYNKYPELRLSFKTRPEGK
jgi:hypothetical protein